MKKRKKLIKRIGALLCAVVVCVSALGASVPYYAYVSDVAQIYSFAHDDSSVYIDISAHDFNVMRDVLEDYPYFVLLKNDTRVYVYYSASPFYLKCDTYLSGGMEYGRIQIATDGVGCVYYSENGGSWVSDNRYSGTNIYSNTQVNLTQKMRSISNYTLSYKLVYSNHDVIINDDNSIMFFASESLSGSSDRYNHSLGYLQNVHVNHVFEDVPLGENVAEKYTSRWYYDNLSTTGVDLTSGDYMIRYYQERWIVTGYGADDVVKKSDRYLLGDYIVQNGYIQTYSEDIDSTLAGQGYEEPGVLDLLWNKFVTTHYYFQIVDVKNNQVGGLLHVYLTDDNGKFGVEHIGETLDNEGNFDEGGYKDFIDEDKVTTDDVEQGFNDLENGSNVDFGTIDGVDEFGVILESFASQVSNVTRGVHALLSSMPPWVLGLLGVSFLLLVVGIIFKIV